MKHDDRTEAFAALAYMRLMMLSGPAIAGTALGWVFVESPSIAAKSVGAGVGFVVGLCAAVLWLVTRRLTVR